jgi:hypothetical protein
MKNVTRKISTAAAALLTVGLVAGCGGKVPKDDVQTQISSALSKQGVKVDKVECPEDLKGEVDAQMTCTATADGKEQDYKVRVTKVEDSKAYFSVLPVESK